MLTGAVIGPLQYLVFYAGSDSPDVTSGLAIMSLIGGAVLGAIIQFLIVAVVVYFVFVLPINHLKKVAFSLKKTPAESLQEQNEELPPTETELLIQIRDLLAVERAAAAGETPTASDHAPKH